MRDRIITSNVQMPGRQRMHEHRTRFARVISALVLLLLAGPVVAEVVYIVPSRAGGPHMQVAQELQSRLDGTLPARFGTKILVSSDKKPASVNAGENDYVVTVGTKAFSNLLQQKSPAKLLATLIPEQTYRTLLQANHRKAGTTSAVFIEQSVQRNLDLVRIALPGKTPGVLLGSTSDNLYRQLEAVRRQQVPSLYLRKMKPEENLISALDQVLKNSNVLIAFADPEVSNRNTAQHLLLTSYRYGIPVMAYSRAYVRAGALMAVYSTPAEYARQAAEMVLLNVQKGNAKLPEPEFPKYFSVDINQKVAHSLGIELKPKHVIEARLRGLRADGDE